MAHLSPAVDLAWKIAISEAVTAGHPEILAEDVMIGLCKLPAFDQEQVPASSRAAVADEVNKLTRVFYDHDLDPVAFYRKLRQTVALDLPGEGPSSMKRAPAAKAAFEEAAKAAGSGSTTSLLLLAALLGPKDSNTARLLAQMHVAVEVLRQAALAAAGVAPTPAPVTAASSLTRIEAPPAPPPPPPPAAEPTPTPRPEVELKPSAEIEMPGRIAAAVDAGAQPFAGHTGAAGAQGLRRGIQLLIELARDFTGASSADDLLDRIEHQLESAFPTATSGAITVMEADRLLLKAHWPRGRPRLSTTLARRAATEQRAFLWKQGESNSPLSMVDIGDTCALYAPMLDGTNVVGVLYVGSQAGSDVFSVDDLELFRAAAGQAGTAMRALRLQAEIRNLDSVRASLLRQFSPRVAEKLSRESGRVRLGGERVSPVTVLMSDVRGFTAASEAMDPADVVDMLNDMFATFVPILFRHDATVDRFIGDAVLAVFGSPEPDEEQWEKAVKAALEMQASVKRLREGWQARGLKTYEVGIGIHTGAALQGFIGSPDRMDYTVIGATVNRASRHCSAAGPGEVLISQEVYERVYRQVEVEPRTVVSKHRDTEPDLEAYLVTGLRS